MPQFEGVVGDQGRRIKLALHPVEGHTVNPVFGVAGSPEPHPSAGGRGRLLQRVVAAHLFKDQQEA